jgi:hypothetical protein
MARSDLRLTTFPRPDNAPEPERVFRHAAVPAGLDPPTAVAAVAPSQI